MKVWGRSYYGMLVMYVADVVVQFVMKNNWKAIICDEEWRGMEWYDRVRCLGDCIG